MIELAHVRNMLIKNRFGNEEKKMLLYVDEIFAALKSPFASLISYGIKNCLSDIENEDYDAAIREINFIHNIPATEADFSRWNENYFYTMEIGVYLDGNDNYKRIKDYIRLICEGQGEVDKVLENLKNNF